MHKWILLIVFCWSVTVSAQERTHHVQQGETLYGISKAFNVSVESLISANPFLSQGLKEGQVLVLPPASTSNRLPSGTQPIDTSRYDVFVVEAGQTLYSLSREWNLTIDHIQELNPAVIEGLKVGQVLKLPKGTLSSESEDISSGGERPGLRKHFVMPGETVYSLSREAGWDESEFFEVNPSVKEEGLESGTFVWLPSDEAKELVQQIVSTEIHPEVIPDSLVEGPAAVRDTEQKPSKYRVVQIEESDSWTTLTRRYKTTREELIDKNPEMMNGLRPGSYIIVPRHSVIEAPSYKPSLSEQWMALGNREIHFAVALPMYLDENDSLVRAYTDGLARPEVYPRSRIALDFYAGLKLAIDTLRSYGLDVTIDIYDTRNDIVRVREIASEIRNSEAQFVIGPLYARNAEAMANIIPDTWIISPLSRTVNTERRTRLVQAVSSLDIERRELAHWINEEARDANVIFVRRNLEAQKVEVQEFLQHVGASESRSITHLTMGEDLLTTQSVRNVLATGRRDVFVILDDDPVLMTSFINSACNVNDSSISLLTTSALLDMRTLEIEKLNRLDVYISDVEFVDYSSLHTHAFLKRFRNEMGTEPQRFAFHGYDVGLYFLPVFSSEEAENQIVWPGNSGIMKKHILADYAGRGPYNEGAFILHLENYIWVKKK